MLTRLGVFMTGFLVVVAVVPSVSGQDELHPIAKDVKAGLKNPSKPFTMFVFLEVKPGAEKKFEAAFAPAVKATRKEKGNIAYQLNRDAKNATQYVLYERWRNIEVLNQHLKTAHITKLLADVKDLLAKEPKVRVMVPVGR